jgi:hypothetical protein
MPEPQPPHPTEANHNHAAGAAATQENGYARLTRQAQWLKIMLMFACPSPISPTAPHRTDARTPCHQGLACVTLTHFRHKIDL